MVINFTIYISLEMLKNINGLVVFKKKLKIVKGRHMTTDKKKTIGHLSDSGDQKRLGNPYQNNDSLGQAVVSAVTV